MVVFICGSCNDTLKKNGVAIHLKHCRSSIISCCDCNKEFSDDSYKEHNQCITEDAKYGPESKKILGVHEKGQLKQDVWLKNIKETVKTMSLSGRAEMALNRLLEFPNIPRKQTKFENFVVNCLHLDSPDIISQLWKICETANKAVADEEKKSQPEEKRFESQEEATQSTDEVKEKEEKSKKDKKKKKKSDDAEPVTESGEVSSVAAAAGVDQEKSEESNQTQDKENSGQSNGITKKSKKKKKQENKEDEEDKEEENQEEETKGGDKKMANGGEAEQTESIPQEEENSESVEKKSKKKKKRKHSEAEDHGDQSNVQEQDVDSAENDSRKKIKDKVKGEGETTTVGEKMDQETNQIEGGDSSELKTDIVNQISWFKQLKRQIKEKETVEFKDFKKMMKRLKKEHGLDGDCNDLISKAKFKLMKRHNYSVSDGIITYKRLF